ncbi:DEAD/DEAH box helicase family protein [Streptomyces sp. NPDC057694]|uniref:DEAD/DEAH box helicase family protein n=1 Tax=Streptomyces sp. NPDC057694 TaxID=3346216 RepID=UPI0036B1DA0D
MSIDASPEGSSEGAGFWQTNAAHLPADFAAFHGMRRTAFERYADSVLTAADELYANAYEAHRWATQERRAVFWHGTGSGKTHSFVNAWLASGRRLLGGRADVVARARELLVVRDEAHLYRPLSREERAWLRERRQETAGPSLSFTAVGAATALWASAESLAQSRHIDIPQSPDDNSQRPISDPPPLAMICGIRGLTVPVVPRAPGQGVSPPAVMSGGGERAASMGIAA